jgi:two-component system cell cycle response regulator
MRILVAEDDPGSSTAIHQTLEQAGHEVRTVTDGASAWEISQDEDAIDLVILSATLAGADPIDWVRRLRHRNRARYTYVMLLGARGVAPADMTLALRSGADDVLWKPADADELKARVLMAHRVIRLHATQASLQDALRVQAMNDPLTGLWNHGAILDMAAREVARSQRERAATSFVLLDVDAFRGINETWGHEAGDVVLREAGRRIRASVRSYDGVGRYGGDVFLMVLPRCEEQDAARLSERVRVNVADTPVNTGLAKVPATLSIGIATRGPDDVRDVAELLRAAEGALARAKEQGRNRVTLASAL